MHEGLAVGFPEVGHLLPELFEEPHGLAVPDRLEALLPREAVLFDAAVDLPQLLVHRVALQGGVALPQVEGARGGDGHEGVVDHPVPVGPGGDRREARHEEGGSEAQPSGAPPGQPDRHQRNEVERRLPGQDRNTPQKAGQGGRPQRRQAVGGEEALEAPPEENDEERLHPEMRGEPDELRVEGGDGGRDDTGPWAEKASADPAQGRNEQRRDDRLSQLHRGQGPKHRVKSADEIEVERRMENHREAHRREGDFGRRQHLRSPGGPHDLVAHRIGGRLQRQEEQARQQPGERQQDEGFLHGPPDILSGGPLLVGRRVNFFARLLDGPSP